MDRRQRSDLLERLVALRRAYHDRTDFDTKSTLTVAAAMAYGERLLRVPQADQTSARIG